MHSNPVPELPPRHAPTLTVEDLAALFNYNVEHFRGRVLPKLQREGFPSRLPGMARWSRRAVMAWIDQQVEPQEAAQ